MNIKEMRDRAIKRRSRLTGLLLILIAVGFLELLSLAQAYYAQRGIRQEAQAKAEGQLNAAHSDIMNIVNQAESAVRNSVWIAQWCLDVPDSLPNIPKLLVHNNPIVAGSTIAMVPGYYKDRPLFAPYTAITNGEIINKSLATAEYDYPSQEWFTKPIELDRGYWSEPYIDKGGGEILMTTYSFPIKDRNGRIAAVLTADLDLGWLTVLTQGIKIYPHAFSTVVSRSGHIMVSPAETLIMNKTINEFAASSKDSASLNKLNRAMLSKKSGSMSITYEGIKNMVYFRPIERTGWAMNIFIPEKEMFAGLKSVNRKIRALQFLGLLLIALIFHAVAKNQLKFKSIADKKEKMENELHIASSIQMSMIPKIFPPFPERKDIDMAATIVPAKEVGGDLYDFFIRNEKLFFCIGDVSGKGVPASLVMAVTRSLFRSLANHEDSPKAIVSSMNDSMADMNESSMFVTFLCCVWDLHTGQLKYCNAGHNAPLLFTNKISSLDVLPNLPLAVMKNFEYVEQEAILHYDDAIFLYTDGITEAENSDRQLFGIERLTKVLSCRKGALESLQSVQNAVSEFVGNAPQNDDRTMLFIHFLSNHNEKENTKTITIHNDINQIHDVFNFVESIAEEKKLSQTLASSINLALEEAVTNVILYAYKPEGKKECEKDMPIDIMAVLGNDELNFVITDSGIPFDPTSAPKANTNTSAEERDIGGLGIHLFMTIMDEVRYNRINGKNVLSMKKKIV